MVAPALADVKINSTGLSWGSGIGEEKAGFRAKANSTGG